MTDKEKEAIKRMTEVRDKNVHTFVDELTTVLNLVKNQEAEIERFKNINSHQSKEIKKAVDYTFELDKEIEKKDKITDEMAKCIDIELSSSRLGTILNKNVKPLESYKKDIKQYFERKVENGKIFK